MLRSDRLRSLLVVLLIVAAGCSSAETPVPVSGHVTYRGKPLPGAIVTFVPETPGVLPASGVTDQSGRFELMTRMPRDGAFAGKHRVMIMARENSQTTTREFSARPQPPGAPLIPEKYFSLETSELTAEVPRGGLTVDFDLKD